MSEVPLYHLRCRAKRELLEGFKVVNQQTGPDSGGLIVLQTGLGCLIVLQISGLQIARSAVLLCCKSLGPGLLILFRIARSRESKYFTQMCSGSEAGS